MADQGKWFKLWESALDDPDLENLELDDWARWARLGTFVKKHGRDGSMDILPPARALQTLLRVSTYEAVIRVLKVMPGYVLEESKSVTANVTIASVTYFLKCTNWNKYQGDFSGDRVKKYRHRVTANVTAQEEKRSRREEKRRETAPQTPRGGVPYGDFLALWNGHCGPLPKADVMTEKRKQKLRLRWIEKPDLPYWQAVVERISRSSFCRGDGSTGWQASIDWIIANDTNHIKVMEGKYDDRGGPHGTNGGKGISGLPDTKSWTPGHSKAHSGLRKVPSAGTILAGIGTLSVPEPDRKQEPREPDHD